MILNLQILDCPLPPGTGRVTVSTIPRAAISPPARTKSPKDISRQLDGLERADQRLRTVHKEGRKPSNFESSFAFEWLKGSPAG
ncbi:MAG: hypothetical protein Ct9H90mP11_05280 [Acidimicrobiales bacterium]|nr:MAG: hypothetical protein Ct9H90mP11_05280 [Acidimicrobiales bacterium]